MAGESALDLAKAIGQCSATLRQLSRANLKALTHLDHVGSMRHERGACLLGPRSALLSPGRSLFKLWQGLAQDLEVCGLGCQRSRGLLEAASNLDDLLIKARALLEETHLSGPLGRNGCDGAIKITLGRRASLGRLGRLGPSLGSKSHRRPSGKDSHLGLRLGVGHRLRGDDAAGAGGHPPPGRGESVALFRDHDEIWTIQRQVDGRIQRADAHGTTEELVEHTGQGRRRTGSHADMGAHQLHPRRQPGTARRCARGRRQHETAGPLSTESLEHLVGGGAPVDHHRSHGGSRRRLDGLLPAGIDDEQIHQRTDNAIDLRDGLPPARARQLIEGPRQHLVAGRGSSRHLFGATRLGVRLRL